MKPGDFFLGVLDFLAILLPGTLATWLALQYISAAWLRSAMTLPFMGGDVPNAFVVGAAFALSSYLLGHFVFMAGSRLDDSYDRWRRRVHASDRDMSYKAAEALRDRITPELQGGDVTVLKWARAYIQVRAGEARVEIDRLEAEQKFFRSLVVLSAIFAAHFIVRERALLTAALAAAMSALSYWRYLDRRWTMTELIYATAVIIDRTSAPSGGAAGAAVTE